MATVTICDSDFITFEECFSAYFRCPACKSDNIVKNFRFCPDCGVELDWKLKEA